MLYFNFQDSGLNLHAIGCVLFLLLTASIGTPKPKRRTMLWKRGASPSCGRHLPN